MVLTTHSAWLLSSLVLGCHGLLSGSGSVIADLQAQMMALMSVANGLSVITETVFENRFMHVSELMRMGADILIHGNSAMVKGIPKLKGAPVMATDLRASASLILAGLAAEGKTELSRVYHIDRGYQEIEKKFAAIGANIKRVSG